MLTAVAVVAAAAWTAGLLMLALTLLDDVPPLSALDNRRDLGLPKPVPGWAALLAAVLMAVAVARAPRQGRRRRRIVADLRRVGTPSHGMVVADRRQPVAIAVPGNPGHVLIISGMLRLLDGRECQAVFAHEQAHLRHHHHRWVTACALAAWWVAYGIPVLILSLGRRVPPRCTCCTGRRATGCCADRPTRSTRTGGCTCTC